VVEGVHFFELYKLKVGVEMSLLNWFMKLGNKKPSYCKTNYEKPHFPTLPTVKFDSALVTGRVKEDLRKNIEALVEVDGNHKQRIYEAALKAVSLGGDLHVLYFALMEIEGLTKKRASEISVRLNNKAMSLIQISRQQSLGITHAIWHHSGAPCMRNPKHPTEEDKEQDRAHRLADGSKFEINKGLMVNGGFTWPGQMEGCRCVSTSILPWRNE